MQRKIKKVFLFRANSREDIRKIVNQAISKLMNSKPGIQVLVKPSLVCPRTGATTDIRLIEETVKCLLDKNIYVLLGEGPGFEFDADKVFEILGVKDLSQKYGIPLINLRKAKTTTVEIGGKVLKKIRLPIPVIESDAILNLPKFKTHMLTGITFAMKNLIGLLPDDERRKAHVFGIHQAIVDLNNFLADKNVLTIGDAITVMGGSGGPAFGETFQRNILVLGQDNVAIDKVACDVFGIPWIKVGYLNLMRRYIESLKIDVIDKTGEVVEPIPLASASFLYKLAYRSVYIFDYLVSPLFKKSLIPRIITRLGTRVEISTKCNKCGMCVEICPVGAISKDYEINFERCRYVRCLKCWEVCPIGAIEIKGFSKPKREVRWT